LFAGADSSVTVRQLDGILAEARAKGAADDAIADRIAHFDLTERLTRAELSHLSSGLGQRTVAALELLADRSAFLDPPAEAIAPDAPPCPAELHAIVKRAVEYTLTYVKELPNIVCLMIVSRFDDQGAGGHGRLRFRDTLSGELTVRDRAESFHIRNAGLIGATANGPGGFEQTPNDLTTSGEFGSILVESFVAHSAFVWHRWEKLGGKRVAVAGYSVPREGSLVTVSFCCGADDQGLHVLSQQAAYQGEMSIDPATGAILRVTQLAVDLPTEFPVRHARTVVEYLPVELGGGSFLLPARSVSFMEVLRPGPRPWGLGYVGGVPPAARGYAHYLNRSEFRDYRRFAAESSLTFDAVPETPPAPALRPQGLTKPR
jgi:hypothetical protein